MKFNCAHTQLVELHKLQENPKNPNKHPDKQIELLAKIIDYQGQRSPIVVSKRSGFITKGHGRLMALQKLGWQKAAVDYQDYENEAQEYADVVADNKIAELAIHDNKKMIEELKVMDNLDRFDLDMLGIEDFSLDDIEHVDAINQGDENSEWSEMPEFKEGEDYVKLIIHFATEIERETYVKERTIPIDRKMNGQWISYHNMTPKEQ